MGLGHSFAMSVKAKKSPRVASRGKVGWWRKSTYATIRHLVQQNLVIKSRALSCSGDPSNDCTLALAVGRSSPRVRPDERMSEAGPLRLVWSLITIPRLGSGCEVALAPNFWLALRLSLIVADQPAPQSCIWSLQMSNEMSDELSTETEM